MYDGGIKEEAGRWLTGLVGVGMLGAMAFRLWRWCSWPGVYNKTVWEAIAGKPDLTLRKVDAWTCGLWELWPNGQPAAVATVVLIAVLLFGAIFNWRRLYILGGCVIIVGYAVNACLMLKMLAEY